MERRSPGCPAPLTLNEQLSACWSPKPRGNDFRVSMSPIRQICPLGEACTELGGCRCRQLKRP